MTYDTFNTIATQLGDGARVDVKIKGKEYKNARVGYLYGMPTIYFDDGSSFWCIDDKAAAMVQELIIHSPQEPMTNHSIKYGGVAFPFTGDVDSPDSIFFNGKEYYKDGVRKEELKQPPQEPMRDIPRNKQGYPKIIVNRYLYRAVAKVKGIEWAKDNMIINRPVPSAKETRVFTPCPSCGHDISSCSKDHNCVPY